MPAFAATALEHDFVFEELRLHRSNPTQELFSVALVCLCEVRPLPAKVRSSGGFVFFDLIETGETRDAARNGEAMRASAASQLPLHDFVAVALSHRIDLNWATARRTLQILQQSFFHGLV